MTIIRYLLSRFSNLLFVGFLAAGFLHTRSAAAAVRDGALRVEVVSAYNLVVDSNAGTPSSYAPRAAYIGVTLHNDGTSALADVLARIGTYDDGIDSTPASTRRGRIRA